CTRPRSGCGRTGSPATSCSSRTTPTRPAIPTAATRTTWSRATCRSSAWPRRSFPSSSPGKFSRARARCCRRRAASTTACLSARSTSARKSPARRPKHLAEETAGAPTSPRSIINTGDEPHADAERYRRLHVIVGDSNMSEVATYLKVGTTALILDMIEDGFFDKDSSLQSPVQAFRDISHDPTLRETVRLKDGRAITPLQLQMEYLEHATRYVQAIDADPITRDVLARWTYVIEQLADDPMQLNREVDWVIKQQLIQAYMEKNRLSWRDPKVSLMDLQYHDIRPDKGLYFSLVRRDLVDRITDDESIERAKHVPPQTTRARLRGEFIRQ